MQCPEKLSRASRLSIKDCDMKKYYLVGIIFFVCLFSISESRSEIALTQEQGQKAAKIDSLIKFYHEQGVFSGVVLVAQAGKVIYQEGFGYANVDTKERLEPKSVFRLASLSKQFTAMCIMILQERGKLDYDDDIQKYLPDSEPSTLISPLSEPLTSISKLPIEAQAPEFIF